MEEQKENNLRLEAKAFGSYLLNGQEPDTTSVDLYVKAHTVRDLEPKDHEEHRVVYLARRRPFFLPVLDSGLAFGKQGHLLRRKLLIMTAILECRPQYAPLFLPKERSAAYLFVILWTGIRAVMRMVAGKIILLFV